MKYTECLNDLWDYFFLCDPVNLSKFKLEQELSDDLISEFTSNTSGDLAVEKGVLIPLSGVVNYPYHIFFQTKENQSIFKEQKHDLQFKKTGYVLEVISGEIYLLTVPYLKQWTEEEGIKAQLSNGIRPKMTMENGRYTVTILGGETLQDSGWEPTLEFIFNKVDNETLFKVENVDFKFEIKSKEY